MLAGIMTCAALLVGCTPFGQMASLDDEYTLDRLSTAAAPWVPGEQLNTTGPVKVGMGASGNRMFVGVARSGCYLVQDYTLSGIKATDPYCVAVTDPRQILEGLKVGPYTAYHMDGRTVVLKTRYALVGDKPSSLEDGVSTQWSANGQKIVECVYERGMARFCRYWDERGALLREVTF